MHDSHSGKLATEGHTLFLCFPNQRTAVAHGLLSPHDFNTSEVPP